MVDIILSASSDLEVKVERGGEAGKYIITKWPVGETYPKPRIV